MSEAENRKLEPEDLLKAAVWRFGDGLTWEHVATRLKCSTKTLERWRKREEWETAKAEAVGTFKHDALAAAWGCLVEQSRQGDVPAAKELLARIEGLISQKHEVGGHGGGPLEVSGDVSRAILADPRARDAILSLFERVAPGLDMGASGPSDGDQEGALDASEALADSEQGVD